MELLNLRYRKLIGAARLIGLQHGTKHGHRLDKMILDRFFCNAQHLRHFFLFQFIDAAHDKYFAAAGRQVVDGVIDVRNSFVAGLFTHILDVFDEIKIHKRRFCLVNDRQGAVTNGGKQIGANVCFDFQRSRVFPEPDKNVGHNFLGILRVGDVTRGKIAKRFVVGKKQRVKRQPVTLFDLKEKGDIVLVLVQGVKFVLKICFR